MQQKTRGIVLKQRSIGENDRILTVLSADLGVIEVSARGVKSVRSALSAPAQILAYSELCLYRGKQSYYILDSAEIQEAFYKLRLDVVKLSLATYLCELCGYLSPGAENASDFLRLLLNTLYLLQEEKQSPAVLKSVFELRALSVGGFMPNLVGCVDCGEYEKPEMLFMPLAGVLVCSDCFPSSPYHREDVIKSAMPAPVLAAMRHIVFSESERIFSFKLASSSLYQLAQVTEGYVKLHTEGKFNSLELYHQLEA